MRHALNPRGVRRDRPADVVLEALRQVSLDYRVTETGMWSWRATCPACRDTTRRTLRISELGDVGGPISLRCSTGCGEAAILTALTLAVRDERETAA